MYETVKIIWAVVGVCLMVLVLLHSPKGDGLAGFSGQAQLFSSTKSAENTLNRVTWFLVAAFLTLTILLGIRFTAPESNLVKPAPAPQTQTPTNQSGQSIPLSLPAGQ
ncbi:MAG: preprotein translocase subunit SecG [Pseudanabaenaceae cyanobacterium]|jgi:preprotein translocase subunit SecG